jgi:hypothetical protein
MTAVDEQRLAEFYVSDLMDWKAACVRAGFYRVSPRTMACQMLLAKTYTTDICRGTSHVRFEITEAATSEPDSTGVSLALEISIRFGIEVKRNGWVELKSSPGYERIRCNRFVRRDSQLRLLVSGIAKLLKFLASFEFPNADSMVDLCVSLFVDSGSRRISDALPLEEVDVFIERVRQVTPARTEPAKMPVARDRHGRCRRQPEQKPVVAQNSKPGRPKKFRKLHPDA